MLITAISLSESFIISKWINKQIATLPQNNTNRTTTTENEESLQLSRMKRQSEDTLKAFVNITQAIPIKTVYIPVRMHQFNKMIPFQQVYSQLTNLKLTLRNLDPASNTRTEECGYLYVIIYTKNSYMYLSQN